jgi:hypothetical protein
MERLYRVEKVCGNGCRINRQSTWLLAAGATTVLEATWLLHGLVLRFGKVTTTAFVRLVRWMRLYLERAPYLAIDSFLDLNATFDPTVLCFSYCTTGVSRGY